MIALVAECDFCPRTVEVDLDLELDAEDLRQMRLDVSSVETGWRVIFTGSTEPTYFCPNCAVAHKLVVDAIDAGLTAVLEHHRASA